MNNRLTTLLLAFILTVVQSVAIAAEVAPVHDGSSQHALMELPHDSCGAAAAPSSDHPDEARQHDCHCHASQLVLIAQPVTVALSAAVHLPVSGFDNVHTGHPARILRPPIV